METPTDPHVKQAQAHLPEVSPSSTYQVVSRWLTTLSVSKVKHVCEGPTSFTPEDCHRRR